MSSSDDPDTNTSDKCVSGERNRERERDSGVVCVLVMWSRIGPSPLRGRPLFWLNQANKTGYYTNSCRFKGKIWQSDSSWYKISKNFNGMSSGRANLFFLLAFASTLVPLVYSSPSTSINFINLHLSPQFILVNKGVTDETARRSSAAFQCPGVALSLL